ncbi:sulfatase [Cyclobacterium sp. 1_MG-2023]|uniref:sulfatase family protein n=1 Tax=Cyclobacterium sp. 1_MG-2023 TaxID=3062681 RepID=UPI0026E2B5B1|nr:sulfatase [Cyclobacterium sp. 1_MG-2023]MDO6436773.1 sulfatase [Cyclobacterium sp. 1_MG-2023]
MKKQLYRYWLTKSFIISFCLIIAACSEKSEITTEVAKAPNIVFIFTDDHAYQAISAYQSRLADLAPTPNIDRIADNGILFNSAYVTNSICAPSRATVLTGTHSHVNGHRTNGDTFDGSQITFPKLLKDNGYTTALIGKWHLKSAPTGFDHWEILPGQGHYYNPDIISATDTSIVEGYVTDIITDKSLEWLAENSKGSKPFMLMLQHKAPHRKWEKGPAHLDLYEDLTFPEPENLFDDYSSRGTAAKTQDMSIEKTMDLTSDLKIWTEATKKGPVFNRTYARMNAEQQANWDATYDPIIADFQAQGLEGKELIQWKYQRYMKDYLATIRSVDENVGRVLDYLEENGLTENTLVVYTSDQGFYLGEHGWFDKRFMYEESFRTPLLMQWKGTIPSGITNDQLVSNLDFAQTFLDMAKIQAPERMQGKSLLPLMAGSKPENWREFLYYHYYEFPAVHSVRKHEGVTGERYKLMHFYELDEWELYDLKEDPREMKNLYYESSYDSLKSAMTDRLKRIKMHYGVITPKSNY